MDLIYWTQAWIASEWVIRVAMLPVILLRKERPSAALAWLAVVFFEPWLGLVIYLLIGENRLGRRRLAVRRRRRAHFRQAEYASVESLHKVDPAVEGGDAVLVHLSEQHGALPVVVGNHVAFHTDTEDVIDRFVADIDRAQHHVHLVAYIYFDDGVGRRVGDALVRAVRRGAACRLMVDAVGSRGMLRRLAPELREQGVEVVAALPANLWRLPFARLDLRNHRKVAVIDGRIAYTGSQNVVEASYGHRKAGPWHDVMARLAGPVVWQLQTVFLEDWFHETGTLLESPGLFPSIPADGEVAIQVIPSGPDLPTEEFRDLIVQTIFLARSRVVITSPYFVPDEGMLMALRMAAQRGVHVVLVVPRRSDHPLVDAAGAWYLEHLSRAGVEVYFHGDGLLHSKTLTIDDWLGMFGSANYDIRSFELNFELNLLIRGPQAVAELYCLQQRYREQSGLAGPLDWPTRTLWGRLKVNFAKLLSPLL